MENSPSILSQIDRENLPKHIGIIMDGNGRWAKKKGLGRTFGHKNAVDAVRAALEACQKLEIPYLTLYAFSTENWSRPKTEVTMLMGLLNQMIQKELSVLDKNNIRILAVGDTSKLPQEVEKSLLAAIEKTAKNTGSTLSLALNYGGKEDILQAINGLIEKGEKNINEEKLKAELYTKDLPPLDLTIRTSGELRISNFLLWDIAYSELYFTDILWPDFNQESLFNAIFDFQKRERRFGKISEQLSKH